MPSRTYTRDAILHVGLRVARQHGDARALAGGVADHEKALEHQREVHDGREDQQQDGEHQRELDQLGAALGTHGDEVVFSP